MSRFRTFSIFSPLKFVFSVKVKFQDSTQPTTAVYNVSISVAVSNEEYPLLFYYTP